MWLPVSRFYKLFFISLAILMGIWIGLNSAKHFSPYSNPSSFILPQKDYFLFYLPALYAHILSSPIVLIVGAFGFSSLIRKRWLKWHILSGKLYISLILCLSAPAGFIMAVFAAGGWPVKLCFILLSVLWWWFSYKGWQSAKERDFEKHRRFMLRSYVFTFSAVNLRILSFIFYLTWQWRGAEAYLAAAWLSWVPFWILMEIYIKIKPNT